MFAKFEEKENEQETAKLAYEEKVKVLRENMAQVKEIKFKNEVVSDLIVELEKLNVFNELENDLGINPDALRQAYVGIVKDKLEANKDKVD